MKITIKKGWFRIAGKIFNWIPQYDIRGIGIDMRYLNQEYLELNIENQDYVLKCEEAKTFIKEHNSIQKMAGGTILGVISKSLLTQK
jgi:hypothetical protein